MKNIIKNKQKELMLFKINQTKVDTYQGYLFYLLNF